MIERHQDSERMGRIESDIIWLKDITGKTADDVTDIKILLAKHDGERKALKWMAHAVGVAIGGFFGFMGGTAK